MSWKVSRFIISGERLEASMEDLKLRQAKAVFKIEAVVGNTIMFTQ